MHDVHSVDEQMGGCCAPQAVGLDRPKAIPPQGLLHSPTNAPDCEILSGFMIDEQISVHFVFDIPGPYFPKVPLGPLKGFLSHRNDTVFPILGLFYEDETLLEINIRDFQLIEFSGPQS